MKSYTYLHGFASSSASGKAQYFQAKMRERGIEMAIPELDAGDFEHLTITGQLAVVAEALGSGPAVLLGSSLGGYLAALYAAGYAEVERVVLLAPAFEFARRWTERMGAGAVQDWSIKRKIPFFHYGAKRERFLDYGLLEDAQRFPGYPDVRQPALVLHGLRDDVVPVEFSRRFCDLHGNARLEVFDAGHEMTEVLPEMWNSVEQFLFDERG